MANIIEMPKLSDTMSVGTLVTWLKQEGDEVATGDMIAEVETDKATMEVETFDDGVMLKHYIKEGDQVAIGEPICAVGEKGEEPPEVDTPSGEPPQEEKEEDDSEAKDQKKEKEEKESKEEQEDDEKEATSSEAKEESASPDSQPATRNSQPDSSETRIKASPLARKVAADIGIDLADVEGTGPGGRITKKDVLAAEKSGGKPKKDSGEKQESPPAAAPTGEALGEDKELPISNMRGAIARALVQSKTQAPHFYLQMEIDAGALNQFRKDLNDNLAELPPEQGGIKFSVNDLILKASAEAVRRVPAINRSWQEDKMVQYGSVHLGFAVAIDDGLVTPVIRDAEAKSLRAISREAKELAKKAKDRKLKPDEMQKSTLTVSNLGMFGISDFYGIINPPNAAILSVGAAIKTPVFDKNDNVVVGYTMKIGLSGDHRAIDGAVGAQYLKALKEILETPATMLV